MLSRRHTEAEARAAVYEVAALAREYEAAEAAIREASPQYAALTQPEPATAADIQAAVGDDTLLLEYFVGEVRSYLWAVDHSGVTLHVVPGRETLEPLARTAYEQVTARNRSSESESAEEKSRRVAEADAAFAKTAARLSSLLLAPAAPALAGRRLLIVADAALQYVPFSALPEPDAAGKDGQQRGSRSSLGTRSSVCLPRPHSSHCAKCPTAAARRRSPSSS